MPGPKQADNNLRPRVLFAVILVAVFLIELLVMFLLPLLPNLSPVQLALLDTFILSIFITPVLFFFSLKPIQATIEDRDQKIVERDNFKQTDLLKNEFISVAAHELRTPVSTIMGYAELLTDQDVKEDFTEEQKTDFVHEIYENCERLNKIVDDILDVSRIESGQKLPLYKKTLPIKELLEKVLKRLSLRTKRHVVLDVRPGVRERWSFDEERIDQVIENLLSNAIKYSASQSTVTIVVEAEEHFCRITVVDSGIGMSDEEQARIFDKFYRADYSNTAIRGLGLGMSIVKQIVEDHGGTILVDSQPGKGTRVSFTLPAALN